MMFASHKAILAELSGVRASVDRLVAVIEQWTEQERTTLASIDRRLSSLEQRYPAANSAQATDRS
jgi:hypothetical protein